MMALDPVFGAIRKEKPAFDPVKLNNRHRELRDSVSSVLSLPDIRRDVPKGLGTTVKGAITRALLLTSKQRQARLNFIQFARQDGFAAGCTVVRRSKLNELGNDRGKLTLQDMGILTFNLCDEVNHDWKVCRVEWLTTPIKVTYETTQSLVRVKEHE
jgi:hypothetical protein